MFMARGLGRKVSFRLSSDAGCIGFVDFSRVFFFGEVSGARGTLLVKVGLL
jgi:hypothetical protein